jgi:hypothetical protein
MIYQSAKIGRLQVGAAIIILGLIAAYTARKAFGLWRGDNAKISDPYLFGFNLNTTVPALLLTGVALACAVAIWYLVLELLTKITVTDESVTVTAPGYKRIYRWEEIAGVQSENQPEDDRASRLRLTLKKPTVPAADVPFWQKLLYPQLLRSDTLLLYPSLPDRPALIALLEQRATSGELRATPSGE